MKQIARGPELNIEKPHDLEVIGYGIESEPNTVGSVFLRLPLLLPLLLLSFCLSACLWLFGRGFVLFDFCSFGLWFVFWVMIFLCVLWVDFSWVWVGYDFSVLWVDFSWRGQSREKRWEV